MIVELLSTDVGARAQIDLIYLGSVAVAIASTHFLMNLSEFIEWPQLWDWSPALATIIAVAPLQVITVEQLMHPAYLPAAVILSALTWLVVVACVAQLAAIVIEETVIPRPAGLDPIEERWPEYVLRGLDHPAHTEDKNA